jgi:SAM-dependent methyltransferase
VAGPSQDASQRDDLRELFIGGEIDSQALKIDSARIAAAYDVIAADYLASKSEPDAALLARLEWLIEGLPAGAQALDLGCGAGHPVLAWLASRVQATGVDISSGQLVLARQFAPTANLIQADIAEITLPEGSYEAVVALYSIIHVPRQRHPAVLEHIYRSLKPGGRFLATMAIEDWEGTETNWMGWGEEMSWSHFDAPKNLAMIQDAGLRIVCAELVTFGGETWLRVQAVRTA